MNIVIDFARLLLQADELALAGRHQPALEVYATMARLRGLNPAETALVSTRLEMLRSAMDQAADSVEVVARSEEHAAPSPEAEAEGLVNQGNLAGAIALYEKLVSADPSHALARERLAELRAASGTGDRGEALVSTQRVPVSTSEPAFEAEAALAAEDWRAALPADPVALLEELLARVQSHRRVA